MRKINVTVLSLVLMLSLGAYAFAADDALDAGGDGTSRIPDQGARVLASAGAASGGMAAAGNAFDVLAP